jgi:hypothetical protein
MKKFLILLIFAVTLVGCNRNNPQGSAESNLPGTQIPDTTDMTNNFYDNTVSNVLHVPDLFVEGEVANPGKVDFSKLATHSVIVKETTLDSTGSDRFTGAYRYDGYSLFDILDKFVLKKANRAEFNPIIDLFVEVENTKGEKIIFSWGEIYYPVNLHKIIIAGSVSRIVPSKTKELWPLPSESKIVAGNDLVTERNISSPVKITVRSISKSFKVEKGMSPVYSAGIKLNAIDKEVGTIGSSDEKQNITFNTIFYGRGKGIHSTSPFTGLLLKDLILNYFPVNRKNLQSGLLCIAGIDGYRCAVSYSELFNRNDQQEFLLVRTKQGEDGGLYRIFAACDFFSDRAVKSVSGIYLLPL